jgi:hypothetical protein
MTRHSDFYSVMFANIEQHKHLYLTQISEDIYTVTPTVVPFPIDANNVTWAVIGIYTKYSANDRKGSTYVEDWDNEECAIILQGLVAEYVGKGSQISLNRWMRLCEILLNFFSNDCVLMPNMEKRIRRELLSWIRSHDRDFP